MGEAVRMLLDAGARRFFVALGGSSTNDGGAGLLVGLGVKLFDADGGELEPTPNALARLARIDVSGLDARLAQASFVAMSDVDNPLTGEHGATAVFGPQKGVASERVGALDASQFTGAGADRITLNGVLAPENGIGKIASLDKLAMMGDAGDAYALVDGIGNVYGAFIIDGLNETATYHTREGSPRKIEFSLTLKRVDDTLLSSLRQAHA